MIACFYVLSGQCLGKNYWMLQFSSLLFKNDQEMDKILRVWQLLFLHGHGSLRKAMLLIAHHLFIPHYFDLHRCKAKPLSGTPRHDLLLYGSAWPKAFLVPGMAKSYKQHFL